MVQDLGRDRVEKRLGQLGLVVIDQQADVVQLDLLPGVVGEVRGIKVALQPLYRLIHPGIVELDALALRPLLAVPVGVFEALLGGAVGVREQPVVAVEAVQHRLRNIERTAVGEAVREHQPRAGV